MQTVPQEQGTGGISFICGILDQHKFLMNCEYAVIRVKVGLGLRNQNLWYRARSNSRDPGYYSIAHASRCLVTCSLRFMLFRVMRGYRPVFRDYYFRLLWPTALCQVRQNQFDAVSLRDS